jgi:hypothetical protein
MRTTSLFLLNSILLTGLAGCAAQPTLVRPVLLVSRTRADATVNIGRNIGSDATPEFSFTNIPAPLPPNPFDVALNNNAEFTLVTGSLASPTGGSLDVLHDGKVPQNDDDPGHNFFFKDATAGGRILINLKRPINIRQFNSYSWQNGKRAAQCYTLYGSNANSSGNPPSQTGANPVSDGWTIIGSPVDTRGLMPLDATPRPRDVTSSGGQYGVSISSSGLIGTFQYLLMVISQTDASDPQSNTFYSEVTVIEAPPGFLVLPQRKNAETAE